MYKIVNVSVFLLVSESQRTVVWPCKCCVYSVTNTNSGKWVQIVGDELYR